MDICSYNPTQTLSHIVETNTAQLKIVAMFCNDPLARLKHSGMVRKFFSPKTGDMLAQMQAYVLDISTTGHMGLYIYDNQKKQGFVVVQNNKSQDQIHINVYQNQILYTFQIKYGLMCMHFTDTSVYEWNNGVAFKLPITNPTRVIIYTKNVAPRVTLLAHSIPVVFVHAIRVWLKRLQSNGFAIRVSLNPSCRQLVDYSDLSIFT